MYAIDPPDLHRFSSWSVQPKHGRNTPTLQRDNPNSLRDESASSGFCVLHLKLTVRRNGDSGSLCIHKQQTARPPAANGARPGFTPGSLCSSGSLRVLLLARCFFLSGLGLPPAASTGTPEAGTYLWAEETRHSTGIGKTGYVIPVVPSTGLRSFRTRPLAAIWRRPTRKVDSSVVSLSESEYNYKFECSVQVNV